MHGLRCSRARRSTWHVPCSPGRFFAADMVKTVVAHMVVNYNLKVQRDTDGMSGGLGFGLKPSAKLGGKVVMERRKAETGT